MTRRAGESDCTANGAIRPRSRTVSRRAFTLLELILVLLILAVAAGVVAPSLTGFAWGRRAEDTATTIRAMIEWAKGRAVDETRPYRLELTVDREGRPEVRLTAQEGAAFVYPGDSAAQSYLVPTGLELEWEEPAEADTTGYITIRQDGTHDAGRLRITDARGRVIYLWSPTEAEPWRVMTAEDRDSEGLR